MVANSLGHGSLTFLVGWCSAVGMDTVFSKEMLTGVVASLSAAFANGAVYLATTIPDSEGDRATGKRTFCVAYGPRATSVLAALLCVCALCATLLIPHNRWVMVLPSVLSLALFVWLAVTARREAAFPTFRWPVVLLSVSVFALFPVYGLLLVVTLLVSRAYYRMRFGLEYPTFKAK